MKNHHQTTTHPAPLIVPLLLLATLVFPQEIVPLKVAAISEWLLPKKKITSLTEFFSRLPESEMPETGMKRMLTAKVKAVDVSTEGIATVRFTIPPEEFPMFLPSRNETILKIPLTGMGLPFAEDQAWSLFLDREGMIARIQAEGTLTHYRKRADGFVEVRLRDSEGRIVEIIPTTVMPPEAEFEDGYFSYVDLFRDAGMVAGTDAVGGPGVLELESISLPDLEPATRNGLAADSSPWRMIRDGGMGAAIPDSQRFAY